MLMKNSWLSGGLDRRNFLGTAGAAAVAWMAGPCWPTASAAETDAGALVPGKDPRLIVHNAKTLEIETPLALLREHTITPPELLFVRNNQELSGARSLEPADAADWSIDIAGLVEFSRSIALADLAKLEQSEVEMVLQCSGNGRAMFSRSAPVNGAPWEIGAMGNVRFRGVPLAALLRHLKVEVPPAARFLTAEGRDGPVGPMDADFEHSIPLGDALERSLLALEMNGQAIAAVHGGPVRLVTPGYYGTMHIKWLGRLRLEPRETLNHHQVRRYRTPLAPIEPGSDFAYGLDNSEPNWRMRIKSVIFAPLDGESLKPGEVEVRGVAWNDGAARIEAVEVSTDGGHTWRGAEFDRPDSPYAWHPWRMRLKLPVGEQRIAARAIDALGRTQPLDGAIGWNPAGYAWNGVHQVRVTIG